MEGVLKMATARTDQQTNPMISFNLLGLPLEIIQLIIHHLKPFLRQLYIPRYGGLEEPGWEQSKLRRKAVSFYGGHPLSYELDLAQAQCLLNWSCTCRYFRQLIAPAIFKTVVLRSKPRSVASIKALMKTNYWSGVQRFVFTGTKTSPNIEFKDGETGEKKYKDGDTDSMLEKKRIHTIEAEMNELRAILSHLPICLASLTLDFPQEWSEEYDFDILYAEPEVNNMRDEVYQIEKLEKTDWYRALLRTVFDAVTSNRFSMERGFDLRLLNIPPLRCLVWESRSFHRLLNRATSFTFATCYYKCGIGWHMNMMSASPIFARRVGSCFLDHLENVTSFTFQADQSWPFGLGPGTGHMDLMLPSIGTSMSKLEKVTFEQIFICKELVDFVVAHVKMLMSIKLIDCYAKGEGGTTMVKEPPMWVDLFTKLAEAEPDQLVEFIVDNPKANYEEIIERDEPIDLIQAADEVLDILEIQDEEELEMGRKGMSQVQIKRRRRDVFCHCYLDERYGIVRQHAKRNMARFLSRVDYDAYLRLIDIVEENIRRADEAQLWSVR